jgi:hypothetical protein
MPMPMSRLLDVRSRERELRLGEMKLRRFCEQPGDCHDAPQQLLAEIVGALQRRREGQRLELAEDEILEGRIELSRRTRELEEALARAEAAEAALKSERESHKRTQALHAAMQTATDDDSPTATAAAVVRASGGDGSTPKIQQKQRHHHQHHHHHQQQKQLDESGDQLTQESTGGGSREDSGPGSSIPRGVVEQIRREKMVLPSADHVGGAAVATDDPALRSLQRTLGRALHKLSQDLCQLLRCTHTHAVCVATGSPELPLDWLNPPTEFLCAVRADRARILRCCRRAWVSRYSSADHFFSELLQNADDNDYDSDVCPTLHVVASEAEAVLLVQNNENGFRAADVRGLCDIGAGTKTAARSSGSGGGRIGRKGIGFKSCFMVSDAPAILSHHPQEGEFCFRFDTGRFGLFGYIVPEWVERSRLFEQLPPCLPLPPPEAGGATGTLLLLPLKRQEGTETPAAEKTAKMRLQLEKIRLAPAALLFLRRLRRVSVELRRQDITASTQRRYWVEPIPSSEVMVAAEATTASSSPPLSLSTSYLRSEESQPAAVDLDEKASSHAVIHGGVTFRRVSEAVCPLLFTPAQRRPLSWAPDLTLEVVTSRDYALFTRTLSLPEAVRRSLAGGADTGHTLGTETALTLAFPLGGSPEQSSASAAQWIFAFLPVCEAGLPFIVQGDWALTSSRQSVHADSVLNLWLRDMIAPTFGLALAALPGLRARVGRYLPLVSSDSEATGVASFWQPVGGLVRAVLRDTSCVRSESGAWCRPSEVLLRADAASACLLSSADLALYCEGKEFAAAPQELGDPTEVQLISLGVRRFGLSDLMACFVNADFVAGLTNKDDSWFDELLSFLHMVVRPDDCAAVAQLPIWRLKAAGSDGRVAAQIESIAEAPIFLTIPASWHGVLSSGVVRVLHSSPTRLAACQFCATMGVIPATAQALTEVILQQHLEAKFTHIREVWAGLRWLKDHAAFLEADDWEDSSAVRELQLALCAPSRAGNLMSLCELACSTFMGIPCLRCYPTPPTQSSATSAPVRSKLAPVRMLTQAMQYEAVATHMPDAAHGGDATTSRPRRSSLLYVSSKIQRLPGASESTVISSLRATATEWEAALASCGSATACMRYDVCILANDAVGVGFASSSFLTEPLHLCRPCTQRPGSLVFFGNGKVWCGAQVMRGAHRFGAGDVVTLCHDGKRGKVFVAINGKVVKLQLESPAMPLRRPVGMPVPEIKLPPHVLVPPCCHGVEMRPLVLVRDPQSSSEGHRLGLPLEQCQVDFTSSQTVPSFEALGAVGLSSVHAAHIRALHGAKRRDLAVDMTAAPECTTTEDIMAWESFFLTVGGARAHYHTCVDRHSWNALGEGECAICLGSFLPKAEVPVQIRNCLHKFHGKCLQQWLSRKATCPVCRGPATGSEVLSIQLEESVSYQLSQIVSDQLGFLAESGEMPSTSEMELDISSWRRWLLGAWKKYSCDEFCNTILRSASVHTTNRGFMPLERCFVETAFRSFGGSTLPYLACTSRASSGTSLNVSLCDILSRLGVGASLTTDSLLSALADCARAVRQDEGPSPHNRLEVFAELYSALDQQLRTDHTEASLEPLRQAFRSSALVFAGGKSFVTLQDTRWDSETISGDDNALLSGRALLKQMFPTLRHFFVERLGVQSVDIKDCVDSLRALTRPELLTFRLKRQHSLASATRLLYGEIDTLMGSQEHKQLPMDLPVLCWEDSDSASTSRSTIMRPASGHILLLDEGHDHAPDAESVAELKNLVLRSTRAYQGLLVAEVVANALAPYPKLKAFALRQRLVYPLLQTMRILEPKVGGEEPAPVWDSMCKQFLCVRWLEEMQTEQCQGQQLQSAVDDLQRRSTAMVQELRLNEVRQHSQHQFAEALQQTLQVNSCTSIEVAVELLPQADSNDGHHTELSQYVTLRADHAMRKQQWRDIDPVNRDVLRTSVAGFCFSLGASLDGGVATSLRYRLAAGRPTLSVHTSANDETLLSDECLRALAKGIVAIFAAQFPWPVCNGWSKQQQAAEEDAAFTFMLERRMELLAADDESEVAPREAETPSRSAEATDQHADTALPSMMPPRRDTCLPSDVSPYAAADNPQHQDSSRRLLASELFQAAISNSAPPWRLPQGAPDASVEHEGVGTRSNSWSGDTLPELTGGGGAGPVDAETVYRIAPEALEAAVYGYLEHHLPGFGPDNWVSRARARFLPSSPAETSEPRSYNFCYDDDNGLICGMPARLLIGIKGHTESLSEVGFSLSAAEIACMRACHEQTTEYLDRSRNLPTKFVLLQVCTRAMIPAGPTNDQNACPTVEVRRCVVNPGRDLGQRLQLTPTQFWAEWAPHATQDVPSEE